jgi:hypothetical protein
MDLCRGTSDSSPPRSDGSRVELDTRFSQENHANQWFAKSTDIVIEKQRGTGSLDELFPRRIFKPSVAIIILINRVYTPL